MHDIATILKQAPGWDLHVSELPWELVSAMSGNVIITVSKPMAFRTSGTIKITDCAFNVYIRGQLIHNQNLKPDNKQLLIETLRGWMAGGGKGVELRKVIEDMP